MTFKKAKTTGDVVNMKIRIDPNRLPIDHSLHSPAILPGRGSSLESPKVFQTITPDFLDICLSMLNKLRNHPASGPFLFPVDEIVPGYYAIV